MTKQLTSVEREQMLTIMSSENNLYMTKTGSLTQLKSLVQNQNTPEDLLPFFFRLDHSLARSRVAGCLSS